MTKKKFKIVLDTNIWISQLFGGIVKINFYKIISSDNIELYVSNDLRNEILDVAGRTKIRKILKANKVVDLKILLNRKTKSIDPSKIDVCRDPKDNFLLSLCLESNADYLITGDEDLLVLESFKHTRIMNLSTFMENYF